MFKVLFNIIDSEIDHIARHALFNDWTVEGKLDYENNSNAYFEYEKFIAQPVIDWCQEQKLDFEINDGEYAMRLLFIFQKESHAMAFKLRWV